MVLGFLKGKKQSETPPKKKKVGRPTKEESEARREMKLKDAQAELRIQELELKQLELAHRRRKLLDGEGDTPTITDKTVRATVKYLRELGLEVVPKGGGKALDEDGIGAIFKDVAGDLIKGAADYIKAQKQAQDAQAEQQPPSPRPQLAPVPPQPQPQPAQAPPPTPEEAGMSIESMILTAQFDGATPEGFARWLLGQPQAGELVKLLQQTPDDHIPALLAQVPQRAPKLAGFAAHLRKNPAKFMAVVQILRRLTTAPSADTGPADSEDVGL